VSNSLFIRSYPARSASIVPASFTARPYGYFLVCLLPVTAVCFFVAALWGIAKPDTWVYIGLGFSLFGFALAIAYLRELKLDITPLGLSFRSLFRRTKFVAFDEISTVVLISPLRFYLRIDPEAIPRSTLIITPNPTTCKRRIRIPLILLDSEAEDEVVRNLKPSIWGYGD
jgi:hypothetical protein